MKKLSIDRYFFFGLAGLLVLLGLLSACQPAELPKSSPYPGPGTPIRQVTVTARPPDTPVEAGYGENPTLDPLTEEKIIQQLKAGSDITLEDNGRTFTYTVGTRFSVFLDDQAYPVQALQCGPESVIGYVSNGSLRGPDLYPIMYETTKAGSCTLSDGDFSVEIKVTE